MHAKSGIPVLDQALVAVAVDGEVVVLSGLAPIGLSLTPQAARRTAQRLLEAAVQAESESHA